MKYLEKRCYHCDRTIQLKSDKSKLCPKCSFDWRRPSFGQRLSAAWEAFKCKPNHRFVTIAAKLDKRVSTTKPEVDETYEAMRADSK